MTPYAPLTLALAAILPTLISALIIPTPSSITPVKRQAHAQPGNTVDTGAAVAIAGCFFIVFVVLASGCIWTHRRHAAAKEIQRARRRAQKAARKAGESSGSSSRKHSRRANPATHDEGQSTFIRDASPERQPEQQTPIPTPNPGRLSRQLADIDSRLSGANNTVLSGDESNCEEAPVRPARRASTPPSRLVSVSVSEVSRGRSPARR